MSDMYKEILVSRKTPVVNKLIKGVLILVTVLGILAGMIFFPLFLVGIAAGVASYFLLPKLEVEYEYLYVNGDLDIDAIYSKQKESVRPAIPWKSWSCWRPPTLTPWIFTKTTRRARLGTLPPEMRTSPPIFWL